MEYIGIDVHHRESQVCIVDEDGHVLLERRVRTSGERFAGEHGQPGRYRDRFGIASGNRDAILLVRLHGRGDAELAQLGHTERLLSEFVVPKDRPHDRRWRRSATR